MIKGKLRAVAFVRSSLTDGPGIERRVAPATNWPPPGKKLLPGNYRSFNSTLTTRRTTSRLNGFSSIGSVVPRRKSA